MSIDRVHPIRRPDVQREIERLSNTFIRLIGGNGKAYIGIEIDYKDGRPCSYGIDFGGGLKRRLKILDSGGNSGVR